MNKSAKNLIVYSLASILLIGVGAPVVQAAPQTREDQKQEEQRRQRPAKPDQTRVAPQRPIVQKPEQPRVDPQRSTVQRQERERTEQHRLNTQRQERERAEQHRLSEQRRDRERAEQNRINTQRQERERAEQHRLSEQRRDRERAEQHRLNEQRRDRENRFRDNNVRRHIYNNDRYRAQHWRESVLRYEHRQPWTWYSRGHANRRIILDDSWNREFPGLRSYRWRGPGFWYQGDEYQDVVLFYDDDDSLVSVGFWDNGQFIMIRDDNRRYYNSNPFVIRYRDSFLNIRINL